MEWNGMVWRIEKCEKIEWNGMRRMVFQNGVQVFVSWIFWLSNIVFQ